MSKNHWFPTTTSSTSFEETGRAELDEHAQPEIASEYNIDLDPKSPSSREQQLDSLRKDLEEISGIVFSVEQPISHLISHMLSGIKASALLIWWSDSKRMLLKIWMSFEGFRSICQVVGRGRYRRWPTLLTLGKA